MITEMRTLKETLWGRIPRVYALVSGAVITVLLWSAGHEMAGQLQSVKEDAERLERAAAVSGAALENLRALKESRSEDAQWYKKELKKLARSSKTVYDTGVSLQEEKRLLEKQLEIMTTYLEVSEKTAKISIMRGGRSLYDCPFSYSPLKLFGDGIKNMPRSARIISKERFAHPQRGKVEEINGKVSWEPPQAGKDPRSGGLGEFVIFTDGPLVIHGAPPKKELHERFPHACAGVSAYSAKKLFENTFIGTKIIYASVDTPMTIKMAGPAAPARPAQKIKNRTIIAKPATTGKKVKKGK